MKGQDIMEAILGIALSLFVAAYVLPPAFVAIANATMTTVNPAVTQLFQVVVPIVAIISIVWHFMPHK